MAKLSSYLWASAVGAIALTSVLASCSTTDDPIDGDGGAAGEGEGGAPAGGTSGTGGTGGTGGSAGADAGSGGDPSQAGAGGSGGAIDENFCELGSAGAGGAGGAGGASGAGGEAGAVESADGRSCAQYCADFFDSCASNAAFADEAECLMSCRFFGNEQLCCRAAAVLVPNCAAAAGDTMCN